MKRFEKTLLHYFGDARTAVFDRHANILFSHRLHARGGGEVAQGAPEEIVGPLRLTRRLSDPRPRVPFVTNV
jgi:hypothetical protein